MCLNCLNDKMLILTAPLDLANDWMLFLQYMKFDCCLKTAFLNVLNQQMSAHEQIPFYWRTNPWKKMLVYKKRLEVLLHFPVKHLNFLSMSSIYSYSTLFLNQHTHPRYSDISQFALWTITNIVWVIRTLFNHGVQEIPHLPLPRLFIKCG